MMRRIFRFRKKDYEILPVYDLRCSKLARSFWKKLKLACTAELVAAKKSGEQQDGSSMTKPCQ